MCAAPGALEHEIARLTSKSAEREAVQLLRERERPDDATDLYSRAVAGHYRRLQAAQIAQSGAALREITTLMQDGFTVEAPDGR